MAYSLFLEGKEDEIRLALQGGDGEEVALRTTPLAFTPWSIIFRDFLRLLHWFPHAASFTQGVLDFFNEPFVLPDDRGTETHFRLELKESARGFAPHLLAWQPSQTDSPAFSVREETALVFLNVLALGLLKREEAEFAVSADDVEEEELFQFHGEVRRIEDEFRATGLNPMWITAEIQRMMAVGKAWDLGIPLPSGVPQPLLRFSEAKVMTPWSNAEIQNLVGILAELERGWGEECRSVSRDSGEGILALENWIFILNLLGFVDRFLAGVLPTRLPNPVAPLLHYMLERFFITQWESGLWPARRSALEQSYQSLVPFLVEG